MPPKKGTRYQRGVDRREQIVDAAIDLFAQRGYRGVGLLEIAERVGITHAGILHHFGTKENLLRAVVERRDLLHNELLGDATDLGLEDFFTKQLAGASSMLEPPVLTRLALVLRAENLSPTAPLHNYFAARDQLVRDFIAAEIRRRQETGEYRRDVDPDHKATEILAFSLGLEAQWLLNPEAIDIESVFASFLRTLHEALTRPDAPRGRRRS